MPNRISLIWMLEPCVLLAMTLCLLSDLLLVPLWAYRLEPRGEHFRRRRPMRAFHLRR